MESLIEALINSKREICLEFKLLNNSKDELRIGMQAVRKQDV